MAGNVYGFNPQTVGRSIQSVKQAYESLMQALCNKTQSDFINGLSSKWCSQEAVDYFKEFKKAIDALLEDSNKTFKSVVEAMDSAASEWARQTGNTGTYVKKGFTYSKKTVNVGGIKSKFTDGTIGVDPTSETTATNALNAIYNNCSTALNSAVNAVNNCGFIGGQQAQTLKYSLNKIRENINSIVESMKVQVSRAISQTNENAKKTADSVSNAFSGNN